VAVLEEAMILLYLAALMAYLWLGVRYAVRVKDKQQAYSWVDWTVLLLFWWFFSFATWMNRH
jgi:hypothetical protein